MCYEQLGEFWNKSKWIDPIASQSLEHQTDLMSDAAESIGERWNWPMLAEEARYNKDHTSEALGKGAVSAASWWAGNALGAGSAAGNAAGAAGSAATQTATTAAEIAAKTAAEEAAKLAAERAVEQAAMGSEGLLSQGFGNTVEAGLMNPNASLANTYMPKNPLDAYRYGAGMSNAPGPGVVAPNQQFNAQLDTAMMNRGMSDYAGRLGNQSKMGRFATKQGLNMMQPEQPQMAPPQRYQHQEQKQQPMYGQQEIPEDLKRKLRAMGYQV